MSRKLLAFAIAVTTALLAQCQVLEPLQQHIPGHYVYTHSWDYNAPDGLGTIHCDEEGVLWFYADGTFADTAVQHHRLTVTDTTAGGSVQPRTLLLDFHYQCPGAWRVDNGKFLFSEHSEGFDMQLLDGSADAWTQRLADKIENQTRPVSTRWFTFDIERLDSEWFIWSYTYKTGRKDTWDMRRSKD